MSSYLLAPRLARPTPVHAHTVAAEEAREAVRRYGAERRAAREAPPELVTRHLPPWLEVDVGALVGAAASFAKAALAAGHVVAARAAGDAVQVGVRHPDVNRVWIRATWKAGRTAGILLDGRKVSVADAKAALAGTIRA